MSGAMKREQQSVRLKQQPAAEALMMKWNLIRCRLWFRHHPDCRRKLYTHSELPHTQYFVSE